MSELAHVPRHCLRCRRTTLHSCREQQDHGRSVYVYRCPKCTRTTKRDAPAMPQKTPTLPPEPTPRRQQTPLQKFADLVPLVEGEAILKFCPECGSTTTPGLMQCWCCQADVRRVQPPRS